MDERERTLLLRFLDDLRELLARWLERKFAPPEQYELLRQAWSEVEPRFGELQRQLESREYDGLLDQHGLSGPELALKLDGFYRALAELQAEERGPPTRGLLSRLFPRRPGSSRRRPSRFLGAALKWANIILGSIGAVIPPAAAIKEFKEAFEAWRGANRVVEVRG